MNDSSQSRKTVLRMTDQGSNTIGNIRSSSILSSSNHEDKSKSLRQNLNTGETSKRNEVLKPLTFGAGDGADAARTHAHVEDDWALE